MNLKDAMKKSKQTGSIQKVTEPADVKSVKINISIRLDLDILNWLKDESLNNGIPYQTLANSILKSAMRASEQEAEKNSNFDLNEIFSFRDTKNERKNPKLEEDDVRKIAKTLQGHINDLENRFESLSNSVFSKAMRREVKKLVNETLEAKMAPSQKRSTKKTS